MKYYPQLDSLRAIAVATVMIQHYYSGHIVPWGFFGVRLFYVLSGFLITSILLTHRTSMIDRGSSLLSVAKNFYVRRTLRLFPIYYLVLTILILTSLALNQDIANILNDWEWHFLYLTNVYIFLKGEWIGPLTHFWTLAVEEQFYILWVWVVLLAQPKRLVPITIFLVLSGPVYRAVTYLLGYDKFADILLLGCIDSLGMGCLMALATHASYSQDSAKIRAYLFNYRRYVNIFIAACAAFLFYIGFAIDRNALLSRIFLNTLSAIVFTWVVYKSYIGFGGTTGKIFSNKTLIYTGKISYGIYVYHNFVPYIYYRAIAPWPETILKNIPLAWRFTSEIHFIAMAAITFLIAALSWKLIEHPINKRKSKYSEGLGSIG